MELGVFCPNPDCPDVRKSGIPGEYVSGITVCPKCQSALVPAKPTTQSPSKECLGTVHKYPTLQMRYLSSLIDGMLLLFAVVIGTIAYQGGNQTVHEARVFFLVVFVMSYEPILTSQLCTVGQKCIGIRVRRYSDQSQRISLGRAYWRTFLKGLLGAYSFFAMGFNKQRRAAHDYAARSIVVEASDT